MTIRLTLLAALDVETILNETAATFGHRQMHAYADIIDRAVSQIDADPMRPGSRECWGFSAPIRQYHLELAAGRRGAAAHSLYYRIDPEAVSVLRVLHQRMEPATHLIAALSQG
ncbi:type II toxin-antitoxin system RelE/ParE family toxin [Magnetospirillum sp. 64-120]|uniref:type II toxin-antitoxin system RelE/ParE family toxin n=1 Tax=Magnetospirillum sp. 64-120 TaxID=1895778 RepID=UPI000925AD43|nr:type II toxin-antitoxin system RelE/ParE family toxin [Magnetospirillum sp. 64-120]OJX68588.1 MAG: hypothetical protein BGO92_19425 [Magnetospirillum sp. 64-120]